MAGSARQREPTAARQGAEIPKHGTAPHPRTSNAFLTRLELSPNEEWFSISLSHASVAQITCTFFAQSVYKNEHRPSGRGAGARAHRVSGECGVRSLGGADLQPEGSAALGVVKEAPAVFAFHDAELGHPARPDAEGNLATRANPVSYSHDTTGSVAFLSEIVFAKDLHGQSGA